MRVHSCAHTRVTGLHEMSALGNNVSSACTLVHETLGKIEVFVKGLACMFLHMATGAVIKAPAAE
jgi:hypothetical protein